MLATHYILLHSLNLVNLAVLFRCQTLSATYIHFTVIWRCAPKHHHHLFAPLSFPTRLAIHLFYKTHISLLQQYFHLSSPDTRPSLSIQLPHSIEGSFCLLSGFVTSLRLVLCKVTGIKSASSCRSPAKTDSITCYSTLVSQLCASIENKCMMMMMKMKFLQS